MSTQPVTPIASADAGALLGIPALTLQRLHQNDYGTYGQLLDAEHRQLCVTLERPAHGAVVCIPAGTYQAHKRLSPHFGYDVFELDGVPGRVAIEIHRGNIVTDSEGCILVGSAFGDVEGQHGITGSADAFTRLMATLHANNRITLTVRDPANEAQAA